MDIDSLLVGKTVQIYLQKTITKEKKPTKKTETFLKIKKATKELHSYLPIPTKTCSWNIY